MSTIQRSNYIHSLLRRELLRLARMEEDLAATEAAAVPYWAACPPTVTGHRAAAVVLRTSADQLLLTSRRSSILPRS
jgi:hypothetical protein